MLAAKACLATWGVHSCVFGHIYCRWPSTENVVGHARAQVGGHKMPFMAVVLGMLPTCAS